MALAGLGHVIRDTIFNTLHATEIKLYVNKYKFILDEDNEKLRVASNSTSLLKLCQVKFTLMAYGIGAPRKKSGVSMASGKI